MKRIIPLIVCISQWLTAPGQQNKISVTPTVNEVAIAFPEPKDLQIHYRWQGR